MTLRPSDAIRLDKAWSRFLAIKLKRQAANRKGLYSEAARLEAEEKRAHIDVAYTYHELDE